MTLSLWMETFVFVATAFFLLIVGRSRKGWRSDSFLFFLYSLVTVITLEVVSERYYSETYYPGASWLHFPGFHFPCAIVFGGALLNLGVMAVSSWLVHPLSRGSMQTTVRAGLPLILMGVSVPIEILFSSIGLWAWREGVPTAWEKWLEVYRYYVVQYYAPYAAAAAMGLWVRRRRR